MPKPYYKPSDLDPPIMHSHRLGYSVDEIAAALGVERWLVVDRIEANIPRNPAPPSAVVKTGPMVKRGLTKRDTRYLAWERATRAAREAREAR